MKCRASLFLLISIVSAGAHAGLSEARQEYAKGEFKKAVVDYQSLAKNSPEYIQSREELAWTYLRLGDWGALRGILPHLNSPLIPLDWRLEGHVLAAISHLKACEYDQVRLEIQRFQTELSPYVQNLELSLKKSPKSKRGLQRRALAKEAITKMRFVKVELESQLQQLKNSGREIKASDVPLVDSRQAAIISNFEDKDQRNWVMAGGRDLWTDEVFRLRSVNASRCEGLWVRQ